MKHVGVFLEDEARDRLSDQRAACRAQQVGGGQVGLPHQALDAQGAIAHGRQVIQVEIAGARQVQRRLRMAQLLVLHLQLDLLLAQGVACLVLARDIAKHQHGADHLVMGVADGRAAVGNVPLASIRAISTVWFASP